ncbi:hypothetical protein PHLGIDRAFT_79469, partial [Phlebiopsis gigantea 11061_1 CR5-6]
MTTLTAADLPLLGAKGAPKKFTGSYSDVDQFLYHYNRLCQKFNVVSDQEKIENISQYCSRSVREVLEGLPAFTGNHWTSFTDDIRKYFEADKEAKRYRINDIEVYVQRTKKGNMRTLEDWNKYNRGFIRIVGWLKREQRINDREANFYFWKGIPRRFRELLEPRIIIKSPMHNTRDPFTISMVCGAAESLLSRDRFDNERLPSDDEDEEMADTESELQDSDGTNNDSETEVPLKKTRQQGSTITDHIIPSPVVQRRSTALGKSQRCFGCGGQGHGMRMCTQLQELASQGIIIRDNQGRYVMKNGDQIAKASFDEPLAQATRPGRLANKGKERMPDAVPRAVNSTPAPEIPVGYPRPVFDPNNDDHIMEDEPRPVQAKHRDEPPHMQSPHSEPEKRPKTELEKRQPRRSELQAFVDTKLMLEKVLRAPITVAIGELLAVSKEMSNQVQDVIKYRSSKPEAKDSNTNSPLIKIQLECFGESIVAIVDTGSQLNIVNHNIWKKRVARPMDITRKIRGNFVSIDERYDGTYLLFKDKNLSVNYEMLVTP